MSNALAIAGVTAVLRDLLNDGLINHDISGVIGSTVVVSALPPDRVLPSDGSENSQLNIFLYQVTPNLGWRNECLPSRDGRGQRLSNPPLALDLHYLLSAYGADDLHAEILLGYAMQLLHETPVLDRNAINVALTPSPNVGTDLPPALRSLESSGLADQLEQIKITPQYLNSEEMSKLWAAMQSNFRSSVAYLATVVLIEQERPTAVSAPVLTRGPVDLVDPMDPMSGRERGIVTEPSLVPPVPTIEKIVLPKQQPSASPGETIVIHGHHLDGGNIAIRFEHQGLSSPIDLSPSPGATFRRIEVDIPDDPANWIVGLYQVTVLVHWPGEPQRRLSNTLPMLLAPTITLLPEPVRDLATGRVTATINCNPEVRANQSASLILGPNEALAAPHPTQTDQLTFVFQDLPAGDYAVRLRIDGIDNWFIDRVATPPIFKDIVTVP